MKKSATLRLHNQQSEVRLALRTLQKQLRAALAYLPRALPPEIQQVDIILVTRKTIQEVHKEFLEDATETDVITFPYGEILVCPGVAVNQALDSGWAVEKEVLLYGIHGMLHLVGFDDTKPDLASEMERVQKEIVERCFTEIKE